jgi:tetratricopeptide (TPR) repeat protein
MSYSLPMKTARIYGILFLAALLIVPVQSVFSQQSASADEFNPTGSTDHGKLISTYREFYKWKEYDHAVVAWRTLFSEFPEVSERLYVDGVSMYRHFIEETPEGQARNEKIDTLMLIYDRRMEYFGGEGNILGRKGNDLIRYRSSDMEQVQAAYGMLKRSLELQGTKSREPVMLNYISAGLLLYRAEMTDNIQVMEDYFQVSGLLDQLEGSSSRWLRTRASIDEMILNEDILSCVGLDLYFGTRFERNSEDPELLGKMIKYYSSAGCKQSDLYIAASENQYRLNPGPESAHQMAMLFISREDLEKAVYYLQMAVFGEDLATETRAEWYYELSVVSLAKGDHCGAIEFARQAIAFKNDHGKASIALGDAFIASRKQLGDDFQQQSAYWAAADKYRHAAQVDPALAEESGQKLSMCTAQFPLKEEMFFHDMQNGDSYRVGGCIRENTTVRSRD